MDIDLGDLVASLNIRVKHRRRYQLAWHIGATVEHGPADRPRPHHRPHTHGGHHLKASIIMDLQADKQVPLSVSVTDELGNPVKSGELVVVYTVDDPAVITLTDAGDGTAVAAAAGLGTATVHVAAEVDGQTLTGDLTLVVVAGLAERLTVTAGEPVEVTPDVF